MDDDVSQRLPTPVRVASDFENEYRGANRHATEVHINIGVTWETVQPIFVRLLRCYGLSPSGFNVLEILRGSFEPLPPSVITDHMLITRGTMTKVLDSLEKSGLVRRTIHPRDRRMLLIEITEEGARRMNALLPRLHQLERQWFDVLTSDEQETLVRLLGSVQARFQELRDTFHPEPDTDGTAK
jgi:DNA-binding MarR family transcriptional regulator